MAFTNNVMIVRHGLLAKLVKLWKENRLLEEIDRLPIELSPRKSKVRGRCCVHKERAVWKYKTLPLLGFDMQDEEDELTPLSEYAKRALFRSENKKENIMCVVDEACSSCVSVNYEITNLCRGCVARSCYMNCPKDAIRFKKNGQAEIDHETCISCGKCHQSCPYHAIVYIPIPCEEVCPVKAISKDEYGVEHIDESKCIYCGKCVNACPFGAIFEISQVFDILQRLRNKEQMVAIVAPSILAQFSAPKEKVYGAIKSLGFEEVVEVAQGAMETTRHEAEELIEKLKEGQPFMTTSCCPSYVQLAEKHIPDLKKYISSTGSPMYYPLTAGTFIASALTVRVFAVIVAAVLSVPSALILSVSGANVYLPFVSGSVVVSLIFLSVPTFLSVYANVPVTVYESVPTNAVAKSLIEIVGSV